MHVHKVTISISQTLYDFVESYQHENQVKSRSEVIAVALNLLAQKQLEAAYCEASHEIESDFESTAGDGLESEAW